MHQFYLYNHVGGPLSTNEVTNRSLETKEPTNKLIDGFLHVDNTFLTQHRTKIHVTPLGHNLRLQSSVNLILEE